MGEDVVITGAGPIGIMAAAIARHSGARFVVVTDVSDYRLDLAKVAGADLVVNTRTGSLAEAQRALGMKEGFDIGLEMSGAPAALAEVIENLNHGGRVAMLGLPKEPFAVDWGKVITHMLTIKGIYGREMYDTWYAMSSMLATSEPFRAAVSSVITHRLACRRVGDGVRDRAVGRLRQGGPRLELRSGRKRRSATEEETVYGTVRDELATTLDEIRDAGLWKAERELTSPQSAHVMTTRAEALNFCANNYLGLADHPDIVAAASKAMTEYGFGMASVRFICGTQVLHTDLERRLASFLGTDAAILYSSCFDANGGVFETLFDAADAIISDELNHASIIDGIRLSKAARYRYRNADMTDLAAQLEAASGARRKVVVTDGVFSMDGSYAPLDAICDLADAARRDGVRRRLARSGVRRGGWPRDARAVRGPGPRRHHHRHDGQGPRRCLGRLRRLAPGGRRPPAPTVPALPVLQLGGAGRRRRLDAGVGDGRGVGRAARGRCAATPRCSGT